MENSYSPSMRKAVSDDNQTITEEDCTEESGWTAYFQDFSNNNNNNNCNHSEENIESYSISCTSSSLVSDAASHAAWKNINNYNNNPSLMINKTPTKLSFKKTRANQVISEDDSLEDTASSPVNSPKVGDLLKKTKVQMNDLDDSMGKRDTSEYYSEVHPKERNIDDFNGKNECIDLKKRGLCLVPLSMLVNFHG